MENTKKSFNEIWDELTTEQKEYLREFIDKQRKDAVKYYKAEQSEQLLCKHSHKYTERHIDLAYLTGVFNVVGIDGLHKEIERLKNIDKNPYDFFTEDLAT